jgi:hypothetical protein
VVLRRGGVFGIAIGCLFLFTRGLCGSGFLWVDEWMGMGLLHLLIVALERGDRGYFAIEVHLLSSLVFLRM